MGNEKVREVFSEAVMKATGEIEFKFTNDGMFKLVLQENTKVLKGLVSSLLHIPEKDITEMVVQNPIVPGDGITDKTFILDIKVMINNKMIINLEMQLVDRKNWQNRSLGYLCRNFDNLQKGEEYISAKPVIHIGFLDYDLFEDDEEFYSVFRMLNTKTRKVFNGNFGLNVVYLNRIKNATDEDKLWGIDGWASLFKARTWEDIRMVAQKNETMVSAVETMYTKHSDEMAREILRRKQDEINYQRHIQRERELLESQKAELEETNADLKTTNADLEAKNADLETENANLETKNTDLETRNADLKTRNADLETKNAELAKEIERLKQQISEMK